MSETLHVQRATVPITAAEAITFSLPLGLIVKEPDTVAELSTFDEGKPRAQLARSGRRIGVRGLQRARGQGDNGRSARGG